MDNALRVQYLEAMGIDVWVPKQKSASNLVIDQGQTLSGMGNQKADWLIVVEAPSSNDSMPDSLFENNAGLLFEEMLRAIDLSYEDIFIIPLIDGIAANHSSSSDEIEDQFCMGNLISQQQLIRPKIIMAIGEKAAQAVLKTRQSLANLSGQCHYINKIPVVVAEHPAYLLSSLLEKRKAMQDLYYAKLIHNEGNKCEAG
jgi:DNA polymerase